MSRRLVFEKRGNAGAALPNAHNKLINMYIFIFNLSQVVTWL